MLQKFDLTILDDEENTNVKRTSGANCKRMNTQMQRVLSCNENEQENLNVHLFKNGMLQKFDLTIWKSSSNPTYLSAGAPTIASAT